MYRTANRASKARRWRRWSEAEAKAALSEWAASGQSATGFARRTGISAQRLAYWKKRLGRTGKMQFVAVALPSSTAPLSTASQGVEIAVSGSGIVVRVREQMDVEYVAHLVEAIAVRVAGRC